MYGIDLGTCSTSIALAGEVLCNKDGYQTTPSKALLQFDTGEVMIPYFKRLIGLTFSQFTANSELVNFFKQFEPQFYITLLPNTADEIAFFIPQCSTFVSVFDVTETFLSSFLNDIPALNWKTGSTISAVITVPANFGPIERNFVKNAFQSVGVNVSHILNEPTAALYAHSLHTLSTCVLVLDCGGGTTDISVVGVDNNIFNVLHSWGDPFLGGNDLTQYICKYIRDYANCNLEIGMGVLYKSCEKAKHQLSSSLSTSVSCGANSVTISRAKFEDLSFPFWTTIKNVVGQFFHLYRFSHVILVGGTTKTPRFTDLINNVSGDITIMKSQNPTCTVSLGASVYAQTLANKTCDNVLIDILGYNLGVEIDGGIMCPIITKLSSLPVSKTVEFSNTIENIDCDPNSIKINVYAGERYLVIDNHFISTLTLQYPHESKAGDLRILVTFSVDTNGLLSVTACDKTNKNITVSASATVLAQSQHNVMDHDDSDHDDMDYKMLDAQLMRTQLNS